MLNPLEATSRIEDNYRRYLLTTFRPRQPRWQEEFSATLSHDFGLAKGPYLEASAPFQTGASVQDLIAEGVLAPALARLEEAGFPIGRPLYLHQERAIRRAVLQRRNLVVATGTGSGKTEAFLLPIINNLLRELETGQHLGAGVRALLLYPMNALANDQVKRLRVLLKPFPELTFGRYVGDTKDDRDIAELDFAKRWPNEPRLTNELIAREQMQHMPPHILLTNYSMLEYLLLRPEDSAFFDGPTARHWSSLVLDEVHTYNGAKGTEIAMLLRRVRDRVLTSERGRLQCFATSATLGDCERDFPAVTAFASALFDEVFEWDATDHARQDVVRAVRRPLTQHPSAYTVPAMLYEPLREAFRVGSSASSLEALVRGEVPAAPSADSVASAEHYLWELLARDAHMERLLGILQSGVVNVREATQNVFGNASSGGALVALVDLGFSARPTPHDASLLPARYHFFLRSLEGAFVCLSPDHPHGEGALRLARFDSCPTCAKRDAQRRMFELATCRRCGAEYVVGTIDAAGACKVLRQAPSTTDRVLHVLLGKAQEVADEDDIAVESEDSASGSLACVLCVGCAAVLDNSSASCNCDGPKGPRIAVTVSQAEAQEGKELRRCLSCGAGGQRNPISRFQTGSEAPLSVIATDLYQSIPPSTQDDMAERPGQGRKLLVFSDSRQDAAFFAPYLEQTYRRAVQRRLIAQSVLRSSDPLRIEDMMPEIRNRAESCAILDPDASTASRSKEVRTWLASELLALDRRQSLDGTGLAEVSLVFPRLLQPPLPLLECGLVVADLWALLRMLLETLRLSGAVSMPEGVDIRDEVFAPRNRMVTVRKQHAEPGVLAWMPSKGTNRRLDIVERVFAARGIKADARDFLAQVWDYLTKAQPWQTVLRSANDPRHGVTWQLDCSRFEWIRATGDHVPRECETCRQVWWQSVDSVCSSFRCTGRLRALTDRDVDADHYARLYRDLEPIGMAVQEHTAQWNAGQASTLQDQFVRGEINVLSCSTTFELGVDVGEVQAVLLRNVPPSAANYIQRAGRAGRRTESAALVVTFAQRRNHDLYYYQHPPAMVEGRIRPPFIHLDNAAIVRRHVHALAFAAFERETGPHKNVGMFFLAEGGTSACDLFVKWLRSTPVTLGAAIARVVPAGVAAAVGVDDWSWVNKLAEPDEDDVAHGWLARAAASARDEMQQLKLRMEEAVARQLFGLAESLKRMANTVSGEPLLGYLATSNVLPKYGFPVDVVQLNLARSGDPLALNLKLDRDLKLALLEYAPGAVLVAGKALWRSHGVVTRPNRSLRKYHYVVCGGCGAMRQRLVEVDPACSVCGSTSAARQGHFVIPEFGFVGLRDSARPGESRPPREGSLESFFSVYQLETPEFSEVPGLSAHVQARYYRQGRVTIVNRGLRGRGFRLCNWCGHADSPTPGTQGTLAAHDDIRVPNRQCAGSSSYVHLGHEYLTDVLEVAMPGLSTEDAARSALYSLLESSSRLGILREDLDGTVSRYSPTAFSLVLFDSVPGGAGHSRRLGRALPELVEAALARVDSCECGEDTSCYSCLRSYGNQLWHDQLSRRVAASVLRLAQS